MPALTLCYNYDRICKQPYFALPVRASTTMTYKRFAEVVLDIPLNKKFHYKIPPSFVNQVGIGKRVKVPFREQNNYRVLCWTNRRIGRRNNKRHNTSSR